MSYNYLKQETCRCGFKHSAEFKINEQPDSDQAKIQEEAVRNAVTNSLKDCQCQTKRIPKYRKLVK